MNSFKKSIKSIKNNKYMRKIKKICGALLIVFAVIFSLANFLGGSFNLFSTSRSDIADFRQDVIILFTFVFILSWFINKKIMILIWFFAFYEVYQMSFRIPELYEQQVYEYCADTNCDVKKCLKDHCLKVKTIF